MKYSFDKLIERGGTNSVKYDLRRAIFGTSDVLPMWVADMDLATPPFITEAIQKRAMHEVYGYSVKSERFDSVFMKWTKNRFGWEIKKNWLSASPGVVPSMAVSVLAFSEPGDKIIIQPPVYPPFFSVVLQNNRKLILNPLRLENGRYKMDLENLAAQIDERTKMIFLCNPHNPVGRAWEKKELQALAELCLKRGILIISDDIHADIVYQPRKHTPIASLSEEISNLTLTCMSPSKSFNMAGLAASLVICENKRLLKTYRDKLEALHLHHGHLFGWVGMEAAYANGDDWLDQALDYLHGNIRYAEDYLKTHMPELKIQAPEGTYLLWIDCRGLNLTDAELKSFMINEAKLGLNDGLLFGEAGSGFQRMNIGCPRATVKEGLERLRSAVEKRRKK